MANDFLNFNPELPERESFIGTQQIFWDSTSLGSLKDCPRKYYYSIVCGVVPASTSVHLRFGILYHSSLEHYDHKRAAGAAHEDALLSAVDYALRNSWEHRLNRPWISDHEEKNRFTLVRTVVDYLDHFCDENETLQTVILPNGKPAVELSFSFDTSYMSPVGRPYKIAGHIDRLARMHGQTFVSDRKTTG